MKRPLISIVIANYNYGRFLEEAICSVVAQGMGEKVELIICDAASTDNSVEIIRKYACGLPPKTHRSEWQDDAKLQTPNCKLISWWCSEKDKGQSDAFNKGFSHACGKYLTWLNADDIYLPGALIAAERAFAHCPQAQWATGNFIRFNQHNKIIIEAEWGPHYVPFILQGKIFPLSIFGPTVFWSREAFDAVGKIDENLHYTMDSDYWRRLTMSGFKYVRINHDVWGFRMHEESKTAEFGSHSRTAERKREMIEETRVSMARSGYRPNRVGGMLKIFMRIVDGSYLRKVWRGCFLVGRNIEQIYDVHIGG